MAKIHGNTGRPKPRSVREKISRSQRTRAIKVREALAEFERLKEQLAKTGVVITEKQS